MRSGAAGNIGYAILFQIAAGRMLGPDQPIHLVLLDIPPMADILQGVVMELQDGAYDLLVGITASTDADEAFADCDVALLIGARPRGKGMLRKDLLTANAGIFKAQGEALNRVAKTSTKVVVVGNPANTNCLVAMTAAPRLPRENFTALTRLDQNRAKTQLALKTGVPVGNIHNVIIWGNHSATQYPDAEHGYVTNTPVPGLTLPLAAAINDDEWMRGAFITTVQKRGAAVIAARKLSSAASAANAIVEHTRDWVLGTNGSVTSMGVCSDGSYGVTPGVIFSFPVTCAYGKYSIVQGLQLSDFAAAKIAATEAELVDERVAALSHVGLL